MALTELQCRTAKCPPERTSVRLSDREGLYLEVSRTGYKSWRVKYRLHGKENRITLGAYPEVTLGAARSATVDVRVQIANGQRPGLGNEALAASAPGKSPASGSGDTEPTFHHVAEAWYSKWAVGKVKRTTFYAWSRLNANIFPTLGSVPIKAIRAQDLVATVLEIEARGAGEVARRTFEVCGQIFRFAVVRGFIASNPIAGVKPGDVFKHVKIKNHPRLPIEQVPELLIKIAGYAGRPQTRLALEFIAVTFVRTHELRHARWGQIDLNKKLWLVPPEIMKTRRPHIVPLARQTLELLLVLKQANLTVYGAGADSADSLLFPGEQRASATMSNNTLLKALERLGYKSRMTGHGFRGVAATALNEAGVRPDLIESQLAHVQDRVRGAYNHALYVDERRQMMQLWADFVEAMRRTGKVPAKIRSHASLAIKSKKIEDAIFESDAIPAP